MRTREIDVVILCGGLGKRLRTEIGEAQKTMAQVNEEPFLNVLLKFMVKQGFHRVILCTGYHAESVEDYYQHNDLGLDIQFSRETEPLGTGGAVKLAQALILSDPCIVLNGDSFCPIEYPLFLDFHFKKKASATIVVSRLPENEERKDFGTIRLDDSQRIIRFDEKITNDASTEMSGSGPGYINAGIYCLAQTTFSLMPQEQRFSLETDFFARSANENFFGYEVKESFLDIGTPERYQKMKRRLDIGSSG